jgi:hypothetical protein
MRVCLDVDEWYPVYTPYRAGHLMFDDSYAVDVDPETLARWEKADEDFARAQREMAAAARGGDEA